MVHKHNNQEHERIMDAAERIRLAAEALYREYHNGDKKLNNHIKVLQEHTTKLIDRLEHHVQNTEDLDDIWKTHQKLIGLIKWGGGIVAAVITGWLLRHLM